MGVAINQIRCEIKESKAEEKKQPRSSESRVCADMHLMTSKHWKDHWAQDSHRSI